MRPLKKLCRHWRRYLTAQGRKSAKGVVIRDYPYHPQARLLDQAAGGQRIRALLENNRASFIALCEEMAKDRPFFEKFPERHHSTPNTTPAWINGWIPPLDGMLLYTLTRLTKPKIYLDIGSGNSTKFVRQAIVDHELKTRIISVDPHPRADIDALCDEVIRCPFEDVGTDVLRYIAPGDLLFQDCSHRSFMNSDTTVFFTELLPALPAGISVGIHDIFLPFDYPPEWSNRFYNEQYLLMMFLLGGGAGHEILFASHFAGRDPEMLRSAIQSLFSIPSLKERSPGGGAFWMRTVNRSL